MLEQILAGGETAILLTVFAAVALLVMGIGIALPQQPNMQQRLGLADAKRLPGAASLSYTDKGSRSLLRRLERSLVPDDEKKRSTTRRILMQAGYYGPYAVTAYYAVRVGLSLVLPAAGLAALPLVFGNPTVQAIYGTSFGLLAAGFLLPAQFLKRRIAKRQRVVREAFPDTLDLLLVCVEAGLGLNAALVRVSEEIADAHPLICHHLHIVTLEMHAGASREQALRNLGERIGLDDVTALVTLLLQSEMMGVSIARTLRVYAAEMRTKRLLRAEEHANKLPVRMVVPLGTMVMPAFMIVVCIPAVIRIVRVAVPAMVSAGQ